MRNLVILLGIFASVAAESVHWQWRELICKKSDDQQNGDPSECTIELKEHENDENPRVVPFNTCFEETNDKGEPRNYCSILCPRAATAYRITRYPQNHKTCFSHLTYRLERRGDDFFMWRDGKCRTDDIRLTIRCEFSSARADFETDDQLFLAERKRLAAL